MAIRPEIPERVPVENVEVEYERPSVPSKLRKPGFTRVRLLEIRQNEIELATRESFPVGEKLNFTMHVKGVKNFLRAEGEIKTTPRRITVFKQPAFSAVVQLGKLSSDQAAKITWAEEQLMPRQRTAPRRREGAAQPPPTGEEPTPEGGRAAAAGAATTAERPAPEDTVEAPEEEAARVKRPVALLQLIEALDKFEVTDDLVVSILEAAEAGLDVEALYPTKPTAEPDEGEEREAEASPAAVPSEGVVRPMNVYRLASNSRLYFSDANLPVGPPSELIYLSRIKSPETCFAVELGTDSMVHSGARSFKPGSVLIFSTTAKAESGDFAFVKTRVSDEFAQVFFEKNEDVRVRPLNPQYRERVLRRTELRALCKLVGCYEDLSA